MHIESETHEIGSAGPIEISAGQAARFLGVSSPTIKRLQAAGRLMASSYTPGGHVRFRYSDVYALRDSLNSKSAAKTEEPE